MSSVAQLLIANNKSAKETFLDLGNCGLMEIPAEIGELVWLEGLSLAGLWLQLRSGNKGAGNVLTSLWPLARLSHLRNLYLGWTEVADLAPLASLTGLRGLDLSGAHVSDLSPLAGLSSLRWLYLRGTQVGDLSPLASLYCLKNLDLSETQITDLSPLVGLTGLRKLDLSQTQVTDLAPLSSLIKGGCPVMRRSFSEGQNSGINVGDCPLTNPPPEVVARGNDAILNYFAERTKGGVDHLYEAKMLIVGEGGAGKTSLLRRLYLPDEDLPTEGDSTKGIVIYKHEFKLKNGRTFRLNVWDFGGQQIYHATHQFFLTHRSLYVLLDDTRKDYKSVSDEGFKYWLDLIDVFGGLSPTLIFQNEKGGRSKAIDFGGIRQRYGNVKDLYAGNLERRDAADKVRAGIEFYAANLSHIGEELPARWLKVRKDIEKLAVKTAYIPEQRYFEVYGKHIDRDEAKARLLSRYFHDLGVFLHFQDDPLLRRVVILQNEWATDAVFHILDDEGVKKKRGRFNEADCARLWKDSAYARMHPELLALMKNFELCYELRDSKPPTWLAPQLLPPAKPEGLENWAKAEDLVLGYKYEFLPKGIVSRLTVRLHRFVKDPDKAWVTGVLFEHGRTEALVEILPSGNEIELRVRGPEHKALLNVIVSDLDELNESFEGLRHKVDKRIPCNCKACAREATPWFFTQRDLLRRNEHGRFKVECGRSYEEVDVKELLDGVKKEKTPVWAKDDHGADSKASGDGPPRTLRIFLASSIQLHKERDQFHLFLSTRNDRFVKQGIYVEIVRWENFFDAMSKTRMQDEYNKAIRECDVFVGLFFTKVGKFTEEEFDVALRAFKETGKPMIFTYFKKAQVDVDGLPEEDFRSLRAFQKRLSDLGHFYTRYFDAADLKLQFRDQLERLLERDHF